MGKLSILYLTLLFSMLFFFHAKGSDTPDQVEDFYANLHSKKLTTTKRCIYLHGTNKVNQVQVAKSLVDGTTPPFFGDIYAFDYTVTAEQDVNSEFLGYGQGFFVESSREQFSALLAINLLLTKYSNSTISFLVLTKYSNSTISFLGQDRFNDKYRELSVVGGTGDFRLATGSATMYNVYRVTDIAIIELTAFVRHYCSIEAPAA